MSVVIVATRGHLEKDCLELKNEKGKRNIIESTDDIVAIADSNSFSTDCAFFFITKDSSFDGWVMKFDCSFHATPNMNLFIPYQCSDSDKSVVGEQC